jgi:hypothetical protein
MLTRRRFKLGKRMLAIGDLNGKRLEILSSWSGKIEVRKLDGQ